MLDSIFLSSDTALGQEMTIMAGFGEAHKLYIQSNLGDSNADFSKPLDFSNLTVSPDLFRYYLM